jgi:hypothetical protein
MPRKMRRNWLLISVIVLIAIAAFVLWMPIGGGVTVNSPDGRFRAEVWGPLKGQWIRVRLDDVKSNKRLYEIKMDYSTGDPILPREMNIVRWAPDSSSVSIMQNGVAVLDIHIPSLNP